MPEIVHAPFTPEQVKNLNDFQHSGVMHSFTCSGGGGPHSDRPDRPAVLIASEDGWRCPVDGCEHRQDWAHIFMADGSWRRVMGQFGPAYPESPPMPTARWWRHGD